MVRCYSFYTAALMINPSSSRYGVHALSLEDPLTTQTNGHTPDDLMVLQRMTVLANKWTPSSPESAFKHYFYNKVPEGQAPFYGPGPADNPKEWDEALQNKPGPGMIPSLASGFEALAHRLKTQRAVIAIFNQKLHEINNCLDAILSKHDLDWSVKMIESRRKHDSLRRRTLVLARKAQVLRNRGYALSADEDELRIKLENMERSVQDPAVNARLDELWSRLIFLREQAQVLKEELAKKGLTEEQVMDSDMEVKIKKVWFRCWLCAELGANELNLDRGRLR